MFIYNNRKIKPLHQQYELGFTLIEMLVGMSMGLLILAGLTMMFSSISNTSRSVASRSDRMGDLYLASHLMQAELRESKAVCWDVTKNRIIYQPMDSAVVLNTANCNTVDASHGSFEFRPPKATKPTPYICWDRPLKARCEELIRDLNLSTPNGLEVSSTNGIMTVTLTASYMNESKANRPLSLRFKTWPRN